jgi:hypothetical protein
MCENGLFSTELMLDKIVQREKKTDPPSMRPASFLISLVGVLLFWSGIAMAKHLYHGEFDWRYMTLSTLLSPRRNPNG